MRLHRDRFPGRPLLDTAVSHALLRGVAAGEIPESLRLYVPGNALLFSTLDARRPGYPRALELAREAGFEPVIRLAGGHAAAFLDESLAFAWASPDDNAQQGIRPRFERLSGWFVAALRRLGLDARVGEIPGEYCPGEYSINIGGRVKVFGVGQRVIRGGAHVGGVLTIGQTAELREILIPIYEALGLELRPEVAGGIADFDASLGAEDVIRAMGEILHGEGVELAPARFDSPLLEVASSLAAHHEADPERRSRSLRGAGSLVAQAGGKALLIGDAPDRKREDPDDEGV